MKLAVATAVLFFIYSANALEMCRKQNGGWGSWMQWSPCSMTCGKGGMRTRHRYCDSPVAKYGGMACVKADSMQSEPCPADQYESCPPEGILSKPIYGKCSKSCGLGQRSKSFTCDAPSSYGKYDKCYMECSGNTMTYMECNNRCAENPLRTAENICRGCMYDAQAAEASPEHPTGFVGNACKLNRPAAMLCRQLAKGTRGIRDMYPSNDWFFLHCSEDGPWCKPCSERSLVYNAKCGQCETTRDGPCTGPGRWQDGQDKQLMAIDHLMDSAEAKKDIFKDEDLW